MPYRIFMVPRLSCPLLIGSSPFRQQSAKCATPFTSGKHRMTRPADAENAPGITQEMPQQVDETEERACHYIFFLDSQTLGHVCSLLPSVMQYAKCIVDLHCNLASYRDSRISLGAGFPEGRRERCRYKAVFYVGTVCYVKRLSSRRSGECIPGNT